MQTAAAWSPPSGSEIDAAIENATHACSTAMTVGASPAATPTEDQHHGGCDESVGQGAPKAVRRNVSQPVTDRTGSRFPLGSASTRRTALRRRIVSCASTSVPRKLLKRSVWRSNPRMGAPQPGPAHLSKDQLHDTSTRAACSTRKFGRSKPAELKRRSLFLSKKEIPAESFPPCLVPQSLRSLFRYPVGRIPRRRTCLRTSSTSPLADVMPPAQGPARVARARCQTCSSPSLAAATAPIRLSACGRRRTDGSSKMR